MKRRIWSTRASPTPRSASAGGSGCCQPASLTQEVDYWYPQSGLGEETGQGLLYACTAALGGETADTTPVQGICPDGWHIPDMSELLAMAADPELPADFLK